MGGPGGGAWEDGVAESAVWPQDTFRRHPGHPDLLLVLSVSDLESPAGQGPTVLTQPPSFQGRRQVSPCGQLVWPLRTSRPVEGQLPCPGPTCPPGRAACQSSEPLRGPLPGGLPSVCKLKMEEDSCRVSQGWSMVRVALSENSEIEESALAARHRVPSPWICQELTWVLWAFTGAGGGAGSLGHLGSFSSCQAPYGTFWLC